MAVSTIIAETPASARSSSERLDTTTAGAQPRFEDTDRGSKSDPAFGSSPPLFGASASPQRYAILRQLGAGAMGRVFLAYDKQLDRRVALKVLGASGARQTARSRLQREAQAMARLSHPNVVTVYEVGDHEGQLFVAMEYVEGPDLRAWLEAERRDWRAILDVFIQAGRGLAAAHEAGIVHRDFKPDNVLIGADGRVRVADFGLARGHELEVLSCDDPRPEDRPHDRLGLTLTRTGAILGTPGYMAPEQLTGEATDARTDQFSFCVSLWEGVYGQRPFAGDELVAVAREVFAERTIEPEGARAAEVPSWLRTTIERGLRREQDQRWPDMHALLDALSDDPVARARRRRRVATLAGVALVSLASCTWLIARELAENARQRYWNQVTESLLEFERARSLEQAQADAAWAEDTTRLGAYRGFQLGDSVTKHEDPTIAAMLLMEVSPEGRARQAWISAANMSLAQPSSRALLRGHTGAIKAMVSSPDATTLYSGSADGEIWRWDVERGAGELLGRCDGPVTQLVFDPEANELIAAAEDGVLRSWSARDPDQARILTRHAGGITSVHLDPRHRRLVTTSRDHTARLVELDGGASVELDGHGQTVYTAAFSPDGARVATASADGDARLWRVADGAPLARLEAHDAPVFHLRFIDEGRLVTGADDRRVRGWLVADPEAPAPSGLELELPAAVTALAVHGDSVAAASVDGSVQLASFDGSEGLTFSGHEGAVMGLAFASDGDALDLVSAGLDGTTRIWAVDGRAAPRILRGRGEPLLRLALGRGQPWLATAGFDGEIRIWDLARARDPLMRELEGHRATIYAAEVNAEGTRVATVSADGSARLWRAPEAVELARLERRAPINAVAFDPTAARLALGDARGAVILWEPDADTHRELGRHRNAVRALAFDPSGTRLVTASSDHDLRLWVVDEPDEPARVLAGHEDVIVDVAFGPAQLASVSRDGQLRLWDAVDGRGLAVLDGHDGPINALAADPGGRGWATASDDGLALLWPDADPRHAIALAGHRDRVVFVSFDASGSRVLTTSADHDVRIWDAADGRCLETLVGHTETVWGARFIGPDRVISHGDDDTVRLWELGGERPPIELTGHQSDVLALALGPGWFVSADADGRAKLWLHERLSADPSALARRLGAATRSCLSEDLRRLVLGQSRAEASEGFAACERAHGRGSPLDEPRP